jgi:Mg-chelatase subunit ChlD
MRPILIRLVLIALTIAALMNPALQFPRSQLDTLILVDISESFAETDRAAALKKAEALAGSHARVVRFAGTTREPINRMQTDLYTALAAVDAKHILLVTDGWENVSSVRELFPKFAERGQHVYPIFPEHPAVQPDCAIALLAAPLNAARNASVPIFTTIANKLATPCVGRLILKHGSQVIDDRDVTIDPNQEKRFESKSDPKQEGLQAINAQFLPKGSTAAESHAARYLSVTEREKVLVLNGTETDARILNAVLEHQKFKVDSRIGLSGEPITKPQLLQYASIILNNVAIKQLSTEFQTALKEVIALGKGMVTFGGERGYGLGGYRDSIIEEAMPLESLPPQTEQKRLNAAVQLVIDKSQSMAQERRLDFVKSAAREVIVGLKPDDYLGVVAYDSQPFVVVPIGRLQEIRASALSQIENIFPTGSTRLMRALQDAGRLIERVPAGRKHIIVLTDGRLPDAGPMYLELVKQLRISGITVSTILLSDDGGSYPLKEMADIGGGVFYVTTDPTKLPRIFMEDIRVSSGERTMKEAERYRIKRGPAGIVSTSLQQFPLLNGYVQTRVRSGADLELQVEGNGTLEPLLASWNYHKGRVISFTSDVYGRWSEEWVRWDPFSQFILDLVQASSAALRQDESLQFDLKPRVEGDKLTLDLAVFSNIAAEAITGSMTFPDGSKKSVQFTMRAKGSYVAEVPSIRTGDYVLALSAGERAFPSMKFFLSPDAFGEKQGQGINVPLLSELASVSGGIVNPATLPAAAANDTEPYPLRQWLVLAILLLILSEIWLRERV